jgi:hypothetical protein
VKLASVPLEAVGNFILKPFKVSDKFELVMVMVIFPLIFNAIQVKLYSNI